MRKELTKIVERIKNEDRKWLNAKRTGQLIVEINYYLGGITNVYITSKKELHSAKRNTE